MLYPRLFGSRTDGSIITIPYVAFAQMGVEQVDPRWLHCGVLTFPPAAERPSFAFVTSGLSNAWDDDRPDPASVSGLGIELRIDAVVDEFWAKDVLLRLAAMQLVIGAGRFTGARLVADGDRIRVGAETFGGRSAMTAFLATKDTTLELPSGTFELIRLFAISEGEREHAAAYGAESLVAALREKTTYPINDITRRSIF
ncbi:MAG TPA: suppressor of fused domain protein [Thermoanaerobaculia bacterium]|nr:suppressor of fused domain protein [Thermoanaerobaculia bacterium]